SAKDVVLAPISALQSAQPAGDGARRASAQGEGASPVIDSRGKLVGNAMVRVIHQNGSVEERRVETGVMNRVHAQIVSGLEPGEVIAVGLKQVDSAERAPQEPQQRRM